MSEEGIPKSVGEFIAKRIGSLEQLEILLYLSEVAGEEKSISDIFNRIQSSLSSVGHRLKELRDAGLLVELPGERFRYEPKTAELRNVVELLAANYRQRRVKVIEAIYTRKPDPMQTFAEAFRFKPKE